MTFNIIVLTALYSWLMGWYTFATPPSKIRGEVKSIATGWLYLGTGLFVVLSFTDQPALLVFKATLWASALTAFVPWALYKLLYRPQRWF